MQSFLCMRGGRKNFFLGCKLLAVIVALGSIPSEVHALQVHSEPEGLYSHQIAHLFFLLSMGIFIFWLRKRGLIKDPGWRWIQWGCVMFMVWNAGAFIGHVVEANMAEEFFMGGGWSKVLMVDTWASPTLYLMVKLDHLSCVPAMIFLYMGLKRIREETLRK